MKTLDRKLLELKSLLPEGVALVAVSKFQPLALIQEAYEAGQRDFGESRVQELLMKIPQMPGDTKWHFIGHLQTNKVRLIIGKTELIQSVDTERLLELIDKESRRADVSTKVLLQVHVALEETKSGFTPEEIENYFAERKFGNLTNTHICGLMCMATNTDDMERVRDDFKSVSLLFNRIKDEIAPDIKKFDMLSMGMSGDWPIAVEEGANIVRIGSAIFGDRNY